MYGQYLKYKLILISFLSQCNYCSLDKKSELRVYYARCLYI